MPESPSRPEPVMFTNLIHRVDASPTSREALQFQWREAARLSLPATSLLTYPSLFMDEAIDQVRELRCDRDELGLHLHDYMCPRFKETYQTSESAFWLLPRDVRLRMLDEMFCRFESLFGKAPESIGGYIIDAWTLKEIKTRHPSIRIAITSCFEEGVKMFYGNNRNWLLFSDGGPWAPYRPSKENALIPARDEAEAIDLVAVPHLNRDMIMALSSRDDWFASHPGNIIRARIQQGAGSDYFFRFLKAWEHQADINGWSYLNIFVSSPWMSAKHWCIEDIDQARLFYSRTLEYLVQREAAGANKNLTMGDFAKAFRSIVPPGSPTLCHWKDELKQSKRQIVWSVNSHHRCAWDMGRGGTLVDLRPYDGHLNGDLGPETELLWNGNHPFLVSTEHCGGHWNTSQHAVLSDGTHSFNIADRRVRATVTRTGTQSWSVLSDPITVSLGEFEIVFQSQWDLDASSSIRIHRRILSCSDDCPALHLKEVFCGRPGTHEYPENLRGIIMGVQAAPSGEALSLPFNYSGNEITLPQADTVSADIPRLNISLHMQALNTTLHGKAVDGRLFAPQFRLELEYPIKPGTDCLTCLKTNALKNP